jgi:hypothetical protein
MEDKAGQTGAAMGEKRTKLSLTGNTMGRRIQSGGKLQAQSASQPSYPMLGRSQSGLPEKNKKTTGRTTTNNKNSNIYFHLFCFY